MRSGGGGGSRPTLPDYQMATQMAHAARHSKHVVSHLGRSHSHEAIVVPNDVFFDSQYDHNEELVDGGKLLSNISSLSVLKMLQLAFHTWTVCMICSK